MLQALKNLFRRRLHEMELSRCVCMGIFFLGALLHYTAVADVPGLGRIEATQENPNVSIVTSQVERTTLQQKSKEIPFTFDADMTPHMLEMLHIGAVHDWYDKKVVDTLMRNNIPATF